ncbi:relaxase/mobilization nuclease domain-containing protein [Asticcacaulis sp.]|uniref:relaxase/mobilization nuclease domain-containing protein n=1 Tax=Asticcacaulis sp. TaxID=1872648 RepID=UPI002BEAE77E|nr:DUF3363 domain-containing protein [Asticcacaulis sp.]HTM82190.1 DUF3363 domain-containing protein [Asticcacaulis sp.]
MRHDDDFQVRPGRIRSKSAQRIRPFIHQALAAAQKAGATVRKGRITSGRSRIGRGRQASLAANRLLTNRTRLAVVKARVVRHRGRTTPLKAHLRYLRREGVTRDGDKAVLFGRDREVVDGADFADRCADDRHHFRFIVSPEDAVQMADLTVFTHDLMSQAEVDLGTSLDWVAVSHWNTEHPHVHVIVRGVTDTGEDLVISREYIKDGMRARAQGLITDELGPRTDTDIRQALHRQIDAERFTQLDRQLLLDSKQDGFVDLAPAGGSQGDDLQVLKAGRLRKLEALGLADQFAPGQWIISERAEHVLRELGDRGDIIKRIHRGLTDSELDRAAQTFVVGAEGRSGTVIGRLLARGLDDELKGTAYIVVDGIDGRTQHFALPSLEASGDSGMGSIISVHFLPGDETTRTMVRVESDLDLKSQIAAEGATWLDRQLVRADQDGIASLGFGAEVKEAMERRRGHLVDMGLASQNGADVALAPNLLHTLKQRELKEVAEALIKSGARGVHIASEGEEIAGVYTRRINLASGRFAVLDDGMGFQLVPWSPKIDRHLGEAISGHMRSRTAMSWDLGRSRSAGIEM